MFRFLKILGFGGFIFLISALWVGHTEGLLLGLLGFSMIVLSVILIFVFNFFLGLGLIAEAGAKTVSKVGNAAFNVAKNNGAFDKIPYIDPTIHSQQINFNESRIRKSRSVDMPASEIPVIEIDHGHPRN